MPCPNAEGIKAITAKIRENTQDDTCVTADIDTMCDEIDEQVDNESP